jgi:hypothetical protein
MSILQKRTRSRVAEDCRSPFERHRQHIVRNVDADDIETGRRDGPKYPFGAGCYAYYHSKLGVRFYDLFSGDAGRNGPVKGDVDFFVDCARQFGGLVL